MLSVPARSHGEAQRSEGRDRESEQDEFAFGSHRSRVGSRSSIIVGALHRSTPAAVEFHAHGLALLIGHVLPTGGICVAHVPVMSMAGSKEQAHQKTGHEYEGQCRRKEREEVEHRPGDDPAEREFPEWLAVVHIVFHMMDDGTGP
jgi:hypothetical protein